MRAAGRSRSPAGPRERSPSLLAAGRRGGARPEGFRLGLPTLPLALGAGAALALLAIVAGGGGGPLAPGRRARARAGGPGSAPSRRRAPWPDRRSRSSRSRRPSSPSPPRHRAWAHAAFLPVVALVYAPGRGPRAGPGRTGGRRAALPDGRGQPAPRPRPLARARLRGGTLSRLPSRAAGAALSRARPRGARSTRSTPSASRCSSCPRMRPRRTPAASFFMALLAVLAGPRAARACCGRRSATKARTASPGSWPSARRSCTTRGSSSRRSRPRSSWPWPCGTARARRRGERRCRTRRRRRLPALAQRALRDPEPSPCSPSRWPRGRAVAWPSPGSRRRSRPRPRWPVPLRISTASSTRAASTAAVPSCRWAGCPRDCPGSCSTRSSASSPTRRCSRWPCPASLSLWRQSRAAGRRGARPRPVRDRGRGIVAHVARRIQSARALPGARRARRSPSRSRRVFAADARGRGAARGLGSLDGSGRDLGPRARAPRSRRDGALLPRGIRGRGVDAPAARLRPRGVARRTARGSPSCGRSRSLAAVAPGGGVEPPTPAGLAARRLGLVVAAGIASRLSDRAHRRDAMPCASSDGRRSRSRGGAVVARAPAVWTTDALGWGPSYEPHRVPEGALIGGRLPLPPGDYTHSDRRRSRAFRTRRRPCSAWGPEGRPPAVAPAVTGRRRPRRRLPGGDPGGDELPPPVGRALHHQGHTAGAGLNLFRRGRSNPMTEEGEDCHER